MINVIEREKSGLSLAFLSRVITTALAVAKFKKSKYEISVFFVAKKEIQQLNRNFRKKDKATDVLSFSQLEGRSLILPKTEPVYLGDIFICVKVAQKQAKELGHAYQREIAVLLIHGVLHLLGYNHEKKNDFIKMNQLEQKIINRLAIK